MADTFGERIRNLRIKKGLTQLALAEMLNRRDSTVRMWELNKNQPSHEFLLRLAQIFNVSTDYLLGQSDFSQAGGQQDMVLEAVSRRPALRELLELIYMAPEEDVAAVLRITSSYLQK